MLRPDNATPYKVFQRVRHQHIMGFGGAIDLNLCSVYPYMDICGIKKEDQQRCLDLVHMAYQHVESTLREQRDQKAKK